MSTVHATRMIFLTKSIHRVTCHLIDDQKMSTVHATRMIFLTKNIHSNGLFSFLHCLKQKRGKHFLVCGVVSCPQRSQKYSLHNLPSPELDHAYICNPENAHSIRLNIKKRKGIGNIDHVLELSEKINKLKQKTGLDDFEEIQLKQLQDELLIEASRIPNTTHPDVMVRNTEDPVEVDSVGKKAKFTFAPKPFHLLARNGGVLRTEQLSFFSGEKSYCYKGILAVLERALVQLAVERLIQKGFNLVSVPDILHPSVIDACGMPTVGEYTQVYHTEPINGVPACLSGTAEMALASYFMDSRLSLDELPQKMVSVSRCYRAEAGGAKSEKGLYRVHQFTKVEMFGVTANETSNESEEMLNEFVSIQKKLYADLGLHFKVFDMPPSDLAAAAHRKYDIEAWMPGRGTYGEISSASNCTDYQSRRLHIKYLSQDGTLKHAHTVNGTACAVVRMLIAIFGTYQNKNGSVTVPEILRPYLNGLETLKKSEKMDIIHFIKGHEKVSRLL